MISTFSHFLLWIFSVLYSQEEHFALRKLISILLLCSQNVWAQEPCRILSKVPDWGHVVGVLYEDSLGMRSIGTAFIISRQNLVMACAHEVGDRKILYFSTMKSDSIFRIYLKEIDTDADLALMESPVDISPFPPLQFASISNISCGDSICYICYNPINHRSLHFTTLVSLTKEMSSSGVKRCMQYIGETIPGNSGGPVLNSYGEVIGIIKGRIISNEMLTNKGCAFPIIPFENCLRN